MHISKRNDVYFSPRTFQKVEKNFVRWIFSKSTLRHVQPCNQYCSAHCCREFNNRLHAEVSFSNCRLPSHAGVEPLQMLTKGQQLIGKAGETKQLECEFYTESFSLFDNPIVWRKTQRLEETQINMMGNLMEPFASAKRFKATFHPHGPRYLFGLIIQGKV
jgi:hypothetical protein